LAPTSGGSGDGVEIGAVLSGENGPDLILEVASTLLISVSSWLTFCICG